MKTFNVTNKYTTVKDNLGFDLTELEKLREAKKEVNSPDLQKKLDERISEEESKYVDKVLATNVAEENRKEREKKRDEALEIVDAVASVIKNLIKWAYRH